MSIKFNCSNADCRRRIEVDDSMLGDSLQCPACGTTQNVPRSKEIKFVCTNSDCRQHVVVNVSEAGRFTRCPSCDKPLRVPGNPPQSLAPERTKQDENLSGALKEARGIVPLTPFRKLLWGWGIGAALFGIILAGFYFRSLAMLPRHLDAIADEIYFHGGLRETPGKNRFGNVLYLQENQDGLDIIQINPVSLQQDDVKHLEKTVIGSEFRWIGLSPDGRSFAYFFNDHLAKKKQVVLCDSGTGEVASSFEVNAVGVVRKGVWLTSRSLVLLDGSSQLYLLNTDANRNLGAYGKEGFVKLTSQQPGQPIRELDSLTADSDHSVAYIANSNIWTFDIPTRQAVQLTRLKNEPLGLCYSHDNHKYLFALKDADGIYEFGPRLAHNAELNQIITNRSSSPQWIQGGAGIVFVGYTNEEKYLVVQTKDEASRTNLFFGANVQNGSVFFAGDKLYAIAFDMREVYRLWEYDLENRFLRKIVSTKASLVFREKIAPIQAFTTNEFGEKVEYFFVPPSHFDSKKRYPVFLDQYSANGPDQAAQLLANAGILYVSANRLGITKWSVFPEFENTMAVYAELLKNPNVDSRRIYTSGQSASTYAAARHISDHPELWRGVFLVCARGWPQIPQKAVYFPSVFISIGDSDIFQGRDFREPSDRCIEDACRHLLPARIDVPHAGHAYHTRDFEECYQKIVKFILTDY